MKFSLPKIATAPFCPPEVAGSVAVDPKATFFKRVLMFAGPGLLISIGYMDPGNWATAIEAGSRYGYSLLFVVLLASLAGMAVQCLCSRLGIATVRIWRNCAASVTASARRAPSGRWRKSPSSPPTLPKCSAAPWRFTCCSVCR